MQKDHSGASVGAPQGKKTRRTQRQKLDASKGPRVLLPLENRAKLTEAKKQLSDAVADCGVPWLIEVIKLGPWAAVEVERDGQAHVIPLHEERSRLWQYAMNFAADRAGMPRIQEMDLVASEGLAEINVKLTGFPRPSDT